MNEGIFAKFWVIPINSILPKEKAPITRVSKIAAATNIRSTPIIFPITLNIARIILPKVSKKF